jgi:hypothetical protein
MAPIKQKGSSRKQWSCKWIIMTLLMLGFCAQLYFRPDFRTKLSAAAAASAGSATTTTTTIHKVYSIEEQNAWLSTSFQAADPAEQAWCVKVLQEGTHWKRGENPGGAQFGQDIFVARNVFLDMAMSSRKGFYVEAGANHYRFLSSSYFFDKCLGWDGLCIEPGEEYHEELRTKRSCTLVPKCLSKEVTQMMLGGMPAHRGAGRFVRPLPSPAAGTNEIKIPDGWKKIDCAPLHTIVEEERNKTMTAGVGVDKNFVDLFVLDVEGAEKIVLDAIQWDQIKFEAILIEDDKLESKERRKFEFDMSMRGYARLHQMAIDSLYVRRGSTALLREKLWYPSDWLSVAGKVAKGN